MMRFADVMARFHNAQARRHSHTAEAWDDVYEGGEVRRPGLIWLGMSLLLATLVAGPVGLVCIAYLVWRFFA